MSELSSRMEKKYDNSKPENYKKILHIWDTAGVASLLSRELKKYDYKSDVIMRTIHDPFGMTKYYGQESVMLEGNPYLTYCKKRAEDYGIIHIHGIYRLVPEYKKMYPNKKIVLQFHGSELSMCEEIEFLVECSKHVDAIICSTPDLIPLVECHSELPKPVLCVNPVDTDLFKPLPEIEKITDKAVYVKIRYIEFDQVQKYLKNNCPWEYVVFDRDQGEAIHCERVGLQFYDMPKFYNKYKKLIDVKIYKHLNGNPAQAWSKTGLEALACGLSVFNHENKIYTALPKEYTPDYHCKSVMSVYNNITNKN